MLSQNIFRSLTHRTMKMCFYNPAKIMGASCNTTRRYSEYIIPSEYSEKLKTRMKKIDVSPYKHKEFDDFLVQSKSIFEEVMPAPFHQQLENFMVGTDGVILIEGLPEDKTLPNTPPQGGLLPANYKKHYISEACAVGVAALLKGDVFNFRQEAFGQAPLVDNVVPVEKLKKQKGAGGFSDNFPFHTESGFHRLSPDFLLLKGVRQDHDAKAITYVTEIREVLRSLSKKEIDILRQPIFKIGAPDLYLQMHDKGIPLGTEKEIITAVISGDLADSDNFRLTLNFNNMHSDDDEGMALLRKVNELLYEKTYKYKLHGGNMVVLDNNYSAHTRNGYTPKYDGEDRWMQRVNVRKELWQKRPLTKYSFFAQQQESAPETKLESEMIFHYLMATGYLNPNGNLTPKFAELEKEIRQQIVSGNAVKIDPLGLKVSPEKEAEIMDTLLRHGPVNRNRTV